MAKKSSLQGFNSVKHEPNVKKVEKVIDSVRVQGASDSSKKDQVVLIPGFK